MVDTRSSLYTQQGGHSGWSASPPAALSELEDAGTRYKNSEECAACSVLYEYMLQKGTAAMLAVKR